MKRIAKLKRTLGFAPAYGAAVGLVVSGTAMFSVGNVAGTASYATFISAFIALIPMMMTAFAFGELAAMLPGGGMISDYTLPALGKFWATFALMSGYLVLIATDGGSQLVMGGVSVEAISGIPQIVVTIGLFTIVTIINILDVRFYGKVEAIATIAMMIVFAMFSFCCSLDIGQSLGIAKPINQDLAFLPKGGWDTVFSATGSAIWFFIGFEFACPMAEENKKPYKNIPYALIIGLITIYVIDSLFAYAAVRYTNINELSSSTIPQTIAAKAMMGNWGYIIMTLLTVMASFTTANAYMSSFPRMLYGLAREGLIPAVFGKINHRTRTPVNGIIFTSILIAVMVAYITVNGADADIVIELINMASITWMVSYAIAMIDVLVLRKKYPDYPRLWKAPCARFTMPIGIIGVIYAIYTLKDSILPAMACMIIIAIYCFVWNKMNHISSDKTPSINELAISIRESSEYLAVWDEEIDVWCKKHS